MLASRLDAKLPAGGLFSKLLFHSLRSFWNANEKLPTADEAEAYLNSLSPDPHSSSICRNEICKGKNLDLQIIVPVYNVEKYVVKCVESILNQHTKYKFRVVLINDGSTDGSLTLIKTFQDDPRIQIINQPNKGFSGARNSGLAAIQANYVTFVDSDDELPPNAIENLMDAAYNYDSDIVQGGFRFRRMNGKLKGGIRLRNTISSTPEHMLGYACGKVYRSELFANLHFPEGYWFEDTINALLLFLKASRFSSINEPVYHYLLNNAGISSTSKGKPKSVDSFYVTRSIIMDAINLSYVGKLGGNTILQQIRCNYFRTYALGEKVRKSIFVLTVELYKLLETYSEFAEQSNQKHSLLITALKTKDFKLYERSCIC